MFEFFSANEFRNGLSTEKSEPNHVYEETEASSPVYEETEQACIYEQPDSTLHYEMASAWHVLCIN